MIANCSGGIEPLFAIAFIRNQAGEEMVDINSCFVEIAKERGFYSDELMKKIAKTGNIQTCNEIPDDIRQVWVTSHDIAPEWHVKMQAAFQKHTDNAVSKTINFCNSATQDDIAKAYLMAYQLKCKGTTVYRDGSRYGQVLNIAKVKTDNSSELIKRERPDTLIGETIKKEIGCGYLYITVNKYTDGQPFEVFTNTGKNGGCASQSEATARMVSLALREGVDVDKISRQLRGIRCSSCIRQGSKVLSCPDAIARALVGNKEKTVETKHIPKKDTEELDHTIYSCPECGVELLHESGCVRCICGYSKCG